MSELGEAYEQTAQSVVDVVLSFIPEHPEIMEMESAWDLFKVDGFSAAISSLQPSLAQAAHALVAAKQRWRKSTHD